jgi:hypothetical protein
VRVEDPGLRTDSNPEAQQAKAKSPGGLEPFPGTPRSGGELGWRRGGWGKPARREWGGSKEREAG